MGRTILTVAIFLLVSSVVTGEGHRIEDIEFRSQGVTLAGSIAFPTNRTVQAGVVFVHGSGEQTRSLLLAKRLAEEGIAALVYDKRGVGKSGGKYEGKQPVSEKNLDLLADDARSALEALSKHPDLKSLPLGLTGISQAGWIVPIAVEKSDLASFIVLWSGPVCKVSEEDIFSIYTADLDSEKVPSYREALSSRKEEYIWPNFLGRDTNPPDNLAKLKIPGLWVFGAKDGSVPVDLSIERLAALIDSGHSYEYVLFSGAGHNNIPETFATATDWIRRTSREIKASQ